jgi:hypothetical protein
MRARGGRRGRTLAARPEREPARTRSRRPQSVCRRERCPAGRVWRNGSRNGVGSRHGHPHYCDRRSRHRSRHRRDPSGALITLPLAVSEEYGLLKLALRPTAPARERYHANPRPARRGNAPLRQRGRVRGLCSAERPTARAVRPGSGERASELARIVRSASSRTDAGHEREAVPAPSMRAAAIVRSSLASRAMTGERSMPTERHRCGVATRLLALQARRVSVCRRAARSAAAPLKRKWCEPGYTVSANVTRGDVFLHARCLVGASRGWADGRRGATRHREFAHAHAL